MRLNAAVQLVVAFDHDPAAGEPLLPGCKLDLGQEGVGVSILRIPEHRQPPGIRQQFPHEFNVLGGQLRRRPGKSCRVAARTRERSNKACRNGIACATHHDGDLVSRLLRGLHRRREPRNDDVRLQGRQFLRDGRKRTVGAGTRPKFDAEITARRISEAPHLALKHVEIRGVVAIADHQGDKIRTLLRRRGAQQPCRCRGADHRNELASSHRQTSMTMTGRQVTSCSTTRLSQPIVAPNLRPPHSATFHCTESVQRRKRGYCPLNRLITNLPPTMKR